ncbi:MAG: type IX secretion system membrane protein PorP/SprF [Bacteroidota bacterium]
MRKIKLIIIAIFLLTGTIGTYAQQDPMFTQYMFNTLSVNPAYAGSRGVLNITGMSRNQWIGMEGAPRTQTFFAHTPFRSENVGLGLSVVNDRIGPTNQTMVYGDYSYTIKITEKSKLAFGLKAGFSILKGNLLSVGTDQPDDQAFAANISYKPLPNFGFGMYYHSERWYMGLSTPKIIENKTESSVEYSKLSEKRHYFFIGGFVTDINQDIKFKPSVLTKVTMGAPVSIDLNANFLFKEKLWVGAGYRIGDSFSATMLIQVSSQLRVGYSYDYTTSKLSNYNFGSHEIMLSYDFKYKKDKILSPRYF